MRKQPQQFFAQPFADIWQYSPFHPKAQVARFLERFTVAGRFDAERFWEFVANPKGRNRSEEPVQAFETPVDQKTARQKQQRRAGWPGICLLLQLSGGRLVLRSPEDLFAFRTVTADAPEGLNVLHNQRQVLKLLLQDRYGATRTFHPERCIQGGLWRHPIAPTHQENLQKLGGLAGIDHPTLQKIIP
jgi:hypothetical protein